MSSCLQLLMECFKTICVIEMTKIGLVLQDEITAVKVRHTALASPFVETSLITESLG